MTTDHHGYFAFLHLLPGIYQAQAQEARRINKGYDAELRDKVLRQLLVQARTRFPYRHA